MQNSTVIACLEPPPQGAHDVVPVRSIPARFHFHRVSGWALKGSPAVYSRLRILALVPGLLLVRTLDG